MKKKKKKKKKKSTLPNIKVEYEHNKDNDVVVEPQAEQVDKSAQCKLHQFHDFSQIVCMPFKDVKFVFSTIRNSCRNIRILFVIRFVCGSSLLHVGGIPR